MRNNKHELAKVACERRRKKKLGKSGTSEWGGNVRRTSVQATQQQKMKRRAPQPGTLRVQSQGFPAFASSEENGGDPASRTPRTGLSMRSGSRAACWECGWRPRQLKRQQDLQGYRIPSTRSTTVVLSRHLPQQFHRAFCCSISDPAPC